MKNAIGISLSERTVVYRPVGVLDAATAPGVADVLARGAQPGTEVVLDLSGVSAFDASGLGALVRALRRIWPAGGRVRIIDPQPHMGSMLSLTGIDRLVPIEVEGAASGGRAA